MILNQSDVEELKCKIRNIKTDIADYKMTIEMFQAKLRQKENQLTVFENILFDHLVKI